MRTHDHLSRRLEVKVKNAYTTCYVVATFVVGELSEELERVLLGIGIVTYTGRQGLDRLPNGAGDIELWGIGCI
ncbi:hypothetical protein [Paenibacillus periandrae]|uniref:hypothetical protein n=1 Tax=Paenibacillus periandrae TaxID=1761741 RepID=UPI001F08BB3E|nr:hypothetical protein [Paenibacillus periandrae]